MYFRQQNGGGAEDEVEQYSECVRRKHVSSGEVQDLTRYCVVNLIRILGVGFDDGHDKPLDFTLHTQYFRAFIT